MGCTAQASKTSLKLSASLDQAEVVWASDQDASKALLFGGFLAKVQLAGDQRVELEERNYKALKSHVCINIRVRLWHFYGEYMIWESAPLDFLKIFSIGWQI